MTVTRQQKEESLTELVGAFKDAKSVVFTQYQGTPVKAMRELRKRLHAKKAKFKVAKKTLMSMAAKQVGFAEIPNEFLVGPIGLAFASADEIAPAKIINDFGKESETIRIVGAIMEGKFLNAVDAKIIASLPGREVLLTQLVGLMMSPIAGFHRTLHGVLRNFVYALSEISKKAPAAPVAVPVTEAAAPAAAPIAEVAASVTEAPAPVAPAA